MGKSHEKILAEEQGMPNCWIQIEKLPNSDIWPITLHTRTKQDILWPFLWNIPKVHIIVQHVNYDPFNLELE